jgi:cell division protein FtsB
MFVNILKFRLKIIVRFLFVMAGIYLVVFSNFGLMDYLNFQTQKTQLEFKLKKVQSEKERILKLVRAISGPVIDINLLEVQARKVLAYARNEEKIFFWK